MTNLYSGNYIKIDHIDEALHKAKINGKLPGVSDSEIKVFVEKFHRVIEERHIKFGDRIDHSEIEDILEIMSRDHSDNVDNQELKTIGEILTDKSFVF